MWLLFSLLSVDACWQNKYIWDKKPLFFPVLYADIFYLVNHKIHSTPNNMARHSRFAPTASLDILETQKALNAKLNDKDEKLIVVLFNRRWEDEK